MCSKNSDQFPVLNRPTDIFAVGKFDYGVMVQYQNLTRKPELFRAPCARAPPRPGPGYDVPPEHPSRRPWFKLVVHSVTARHPKMDSNHYPFD